MPAWTKDTALAALRELAEEAKALSENKGAQITISSPICPLCQGHGELGARKCSRCDGRGRIPVGAGSTEHTRWTARCLAVLEEVFGRKSRYYLSFAALQWYETGSFMFGGPGDELGSWRPQAAIERRHHEAYLRDLGTARGFLLAAADHLERSDLASVYEGKDTAPESSAIIKVINLAGSPLRKVTREVPKKEKEVQHSFENLLVGADIPFSREAERVEYSSKTYVPDFTLPQLDLAVEIKLCDGPGREKEMIAEINDDIPAYQKKFGNLLFVIYDVGQIADVDRFTKSFEEHQNVVVKVVKH